MRNKAIDETDARILKTLLKESRTSFTDMARDCGISIAAIRKRYNRLLKDGIINGEIMQIDPASLGYKCIVNIGAVTAREDENKVMEFLRGKPYSCAVFSNVFEKTNVAAIISLREVQELMEVIRDIEANPLVKHTTAFIWSRTSGLDHPENLVLRNSIDATGSDPASAPSAGGLEKAKMDDTDRQIASILSQKSRTPFVKIAEALGISTKKVIQRYDRLRGTVLVSSTITVNLRKIGYNAMAHLLIKVANRSKMPEVLTSLVKTPNLITVLELVGGGYDLFPIMVLRDYEELFKLKERMSAIRSIEQFDMVLSPPYYAWPLNLFSKLLK